MKIGFNTTKPTYGAHISSKNYSSQVLSVFFRVKLVFNYQRVTVTMPFVVAFVGKKQQKLSKTHLAAQSSHRAFFTALRMGYNHNI